MFMGWDDWARVTWERVSKHVIERDSLLPG